tara:strand:+ start:870 stop:1415 length:546 start_codon:yes stop_codon:yes gene_type:complete
MHPLTEVQQYTIAFELNNMQNIRLSLMLLCVAMMIPLSGCTESSSGWCGVGYDEMYGGYDYTYSTKNVGPDNSLNVTIELLRVGGGWLEDSEEHQEGQSVWVTLYVKMNDGSEHGIAFNNNDWEVNGDYNNGSYWSTNLYYQSSAGFCDYGCDQVKFSAGDEYGAIYYDGTCESSPWIELA